MTIEQDVEKMALQEERLQFANFDAESAWALGCALREEALRRGYKIAIEVRQMGFPLFYSALPGSSPDNADWLRRKRNVVERFHKSSYAIGHNLLQRGLTITERYGIALADFAAAGGGFPIRVRGTGVVGFVGVSGLAQRDDHGFIVEVLAQMLGESVAELALGEE